MKLCSLRQTVPAVAAIAALTLILSACSGGDTPAPTAPPSSNATSTEGESTDPQTSAAPAGTPSCEDGTVEGEATADFVTLGSPKATVDADGSTRFALPYTLTNPLAVPCIIKPVIHFTEEGEEQDTYQARVFVPAGASVELEVYSLRAYFLYDDASTEPVPPLDHTITVPEVDTIAVYATYFDADVTIGDVTGEGDAATVNVRIDQRAALLTEPFDMGAAKGTGLFLQGLDADGNLVAPILLNISTPEEGTQVEFDVPLAASADPNFADDAIVVVPFPLEAITTIKSFVVGSYQPLVTLG